MGTEKEQTTSERDSGLKLGPEWGSHGDSETVQRQQLQSDSLGENSDTRPLLSSRTTNSPAFNEIEKKLACSDFPIHFRRKTRARGKKKKKKRRLGMIRMDMHALWMVKQRKELGTKNEACVIIELKRKRHRITW